MKKEWYYINNEFEVDTPTLLVYPERVMRNIEHLKKSTSDPSRLRPHVKTHKTKEIVSLHIAAGITKFKCATIAEAEMVGSCGAKDVLLAYPLYGPKIKRYVDLVKKMPQTSFSALVDNECAAVKLSRYSKHSGVVANVYVDVNVGMDRTGIELGNDAMQLYTLCYADYVLNIKGFHVYDGHVKEPNASRRNQICDLLYGQVEDICNLLIAQGKPTPEVVIGGTPTFPAYADHPRVEFSPGTYVFWDRGYAEQYPELPFISAAILMTRIISKPQKGLLCVDLGYKSVASETALETRISFLNARDFTIVSQNEEHLVLRCPTTNSWESGDVLYGIPYHICPTVALYSQLSVVEGGRVVREWDVVGRDRKIAV